MINHDNKLNQQFNQNFLDFAQKPEKWLFDLVLCNTQQGPFGLIIKKRCALFFQALCCALQSASMNDQDLNAKIKLSYSKIDPAGACDPKTLFFLNVYTAQLQLLFFSQNSPATLINSSQNLTAEAPHSSFSQPQPQPQNILSTENPLTNKTQIIAKNDTKKTQHTVCFNNDTSSIKVAPINKIKPQIARSYR